jgi:hypothetical protein
MYVRGSEKSSPYSNEKKYREKYQIPIPISIKSKHSMNLIFMRIMRDLSKYLSLWWSVEMSEQYCFFEMFMRNHHRWKRQKLSIENGQNEPEPLFIIEHSYRDFGTSENTRLQVNGMMIIEFSLK